MSAQAAETSYDGDGRHGRPEDSAGLRNIVWDRENILAETDSGGSTVARYSMNPQAYGELVSQRRSGASAFYHYDALGSTRALTNAAQTPTDTADYKAFGITNASSGSTVNPFRWVGRLGYYHQADYSDYWLRARTFRPTMGRFVSRDPVCGGLIPGSPSRRNTRTEIGSISMHGPWPGSTDGPTQHRRLRAFRVRSARHAHCRTRILAIRIQRVSAGTGMVMSRAGALDGTEGQ